jgi:hypothetical protein
MKFKFSKNNFAVIKTALKKRKKHFPLRFFFTWLYTLQIKPQIHAQFRSYDLGDTLF